MKSKRENDLARQSNDNARRQKRRKNRSEWHAAQEKIRLAELADTETLVFEIEVKIPKSAVNFSRQSVYGLEGDEAHDALMQLCLNKVKHQPLRDFEVTGWGFKENNE